MTTDVRLLGPADVRELAAGLDVRPTKQRGQNFVIDPNTIRRIVAAAGLRPGEQVLEIGPGLGSLTLGLLAAGHRVTAVEIDERMAERLPVTVEAYAPGHGGDLDVVAADAMRLAAGDLASTPTACVANLPYNVAVPVLLHLLATFESIATVLVMVQREVADRLAAPPGSRTYGIPSAKAAWYGEVTRAGSVGRTVFWPAPNVDSGLVRLVRREPAQRTADVDQEAVFAVIDAAFSARRKTLRQALLGWARGLDSGDPRTFLDTTLRTAGIDPAARGETLDVRDFVAVAVAADRLRRSQSTG